MNSPVENQEELVELILRVYSAAKQAPPVVEGLLVKDMHLTPLQEDMSKLIMRRYSLEDALSDDGVNSSCNSKICGADQTVLLIGKPHSVDVDAES